MIRFLFTISTFLNVLAHAGAQSVITGQVTDKNDSVPLEGVYVVYNKDKGVVTGPDGRYSFSSDTGTISVTLRFIGYRDITRHLKIGKIDTITADFQMETEIQEIGQIIVSASRTDQKIAEQSVSIDIIKAVDLNKTHITDSKELINKTSGIEVVDGQASIRGGTGFSYGVGSRVLALIDGLPVLSPDAGNIKWQFLPLENISQIEVIKGASSVLYGSSAMNGIINFRTAMAGKDPETKFHAETSIFDKPSNRNWVWWKKPRISSNLSLSHVQKTGNTDLGIGFNLSDYNSYRKFNDETLTRLSFKIKHDNLRIDGLSYGVNLNSGLTKKTDFVLWKDATTGALVQDTSTVSMLNGRFIAIDPFIRFKNNGPLEHELRFRLQSAVNKFPVRQDNNSDASSIYGEYQLTFEPDDNFGIVAGLASTFSRIVANLYGDHNGVNMAGFAQAEGTPIKNVKLVAGIRLENNRLDGINDKLATVFRTGFNWQVAGYTYIRGSFGQGYRYPSIAEKYASTTLGAVRIYPNPFIEPETGWTSEIGIKQGIAAGTITGQADVSVFLIQNKNMIEYIFGYYPDIRTDQYNFGFQASNIEQSRIHGFETEFILHIPGKISTSLSGGYTYIHPVEINIFTGRSTGNYLKYRRKHSVKIVADAGFRRISGSIGIYYRSRLLSIDNVFTDELTRENILPGFYDYWTTHNTGYFMMDSSISYELTKKFSLSVAVKNLTNTEYTGRPGDIQPHRNFSLRFSGKF